MHQGDIYFLILRRIQPIKHDGLLSGNTIWKLSEYQINVAWNSPQLHNIKEQHWKQSLLVLVANDSIQFFMYFSKQYLLLCFWKHLFSICRLLLTKHMKRCQPVFQKSKFMFKNLLAEDRGNMPRSAEMSASPSKLGPARTVPVGDIMTLPPAQTTESGVRSSSLPENTYSGGGG